MILKLSNIFTVVFLVFSSVTFTQNFSHNVAANNKKYFVSDLQKQADILHYHLIIDLNTEEKILNGTAKLMATKNPELDLNSELELNLYDNLIVTSIKVNGSTAEYT